MKRLIILLVLIVISCNSKKSESMKYFEEINELNSILLENKSKLNIKDNLDSISLKISKTNDLIQNLKKNIRLSKIEYHEKIKKQKGSEKSGFAYYFRNKSSKTEKYIILIFAEDKSTLYEFKYFEQFIDCGYNENINENWEIVEIDPTCND